MNPPPSADLSAQLEQYRATLASLDDLIFVFDADDRFIDFHAPSVSKLAMPPEAFLGRKYQECIQGAPLQLLDRAMTAVRKGARSESFDYMMEVAGEPRWWSAKLTPRHDPSGAFTGATLVSRDITVRKHAEAERVLLAEKQARNLIATPPQLTLADLFDIDELQRIQDAFSAATGVASIITGPDGRPITRPSNFCHLCQLIRRTETGRCNCEQSDAIIGRLHREGPVMQPCLSGGLWDGGTSICVADLHVANWLIGQVRDDSVDDEAMVAYARTIGADEAIYREALRAVPRMPRENFAKICEALYLIGAQLSKLAYQNLQQSRFIAERDQLEERLRQAEKLRAVGQLAGGVAHDFNNILTAQLMHIELLREHHDLPADVVEAIAALQTGAHMAADLTRQLLAFSRRQVLQPRRLELGHQIRQLLRMLSRLLREDIALRFEPAESPLWVEADPSMIEQVVMNLLVNARDAMPQGGTITIHLGARTIPATPPPTEPAARPGEFACLTVADTGTGMKEETLGRIFEPFFTTKEQGHGTGLGLATVYGIVQQHHGWISVDSQLGEGTAFHVYFPQVPVPISTGQEAAPAAPGGGGETVLVVEDEPGVRRVLEKALQRIGYRVLTASNADAALPIWTEQRDHIRLLFTDMVMPGSLNGLQLARRLRADNPELPVLIASGYSSVMVESGLSPEERIHFVSKPFEVTKLAETIREALAKGATGPG